MRSLPGPLGSLAVFFLLFLLYLFVLSSPVNAQVSSPYCGDNFCDPDETGWCSDCTVQPYCGDGFCDVGESSWCSDCAVASYYCGDGFCDGGESGWCSDCTAKPFCGDGFCDAGEQSVCAKDCGACDEKLLDSYRCSGNDRQREKIAADCVTKQWLTVETCQYGCDPASATCRQAPPAPVCPPGSRRWGSLPETLSPSLCQYGWTAIADCNQYGQWVFVDCISPEEEGCTPAVSCFALGCGKTDSCGSFCGACPAPAVVDNAPTATINVPASAAPGSQLSVVVSGNDDKDVSQLQLYDANNNLLETFDCAGIQTSCSKTFTKTAPAAFSTAYTFKARSKDSANQLSAFVSGTGATTAAPIVPPVVPPVFPPVTPSPVLELPKPLQVVSVKFPLQPLFLRALNFPDSDCVRPGESALLAVKVQNTAKAALKDLKFTAAVPELGIRVSGGPAKLKANGKLTQLLRLDIPEDAEEDTYYLRFSISNNKFNRIIHRTFVVDKNC